jgi:hypothetical protein
MSTIAIKEGRLVVVVNDLDFEIKDVTFEAKVFNKYGTFDRIAYRTMKYSRYTYLHCDWLDMTVLTTITFKVKSPHIQMHAFDGGFFGIESKSKQGFDNCDMHIVTIVESTTIVLSIFSFQLELVPLFFQIDSIKKFRNYIQKLEISKC